MLVDHLAFMIDAARTYIERKRVDHIAFVIGARTYSSGNLRN